MVAVCDTSIDSRDRFQEVGCHGGQTVGVCTCNRVPGKEPSDFGLNVGGTPMGFLIGLRKLGDRPSVNMGLGSCVGLSLACLGR